MVTRAIGIAVVLMMLSAGSPCGAAPARTSSRRVDGRGLPVGGLHKQIEEIAEVIELPIRHPEKLARLGIEAPSGVLLHGPPRNGKTSLARAIAERSGAHVEVISGSEIAAPGLGEQEARLREVFERAAQHKPAVIIIDEIDVLAPSRDRADVHGRRLTTQLLTLMDGIKKRDGVIVVATSNRPGDLDPALRQPGRLEREIHIGQPDLEGRHEILSLHTARMPLDENVDLRALAEQTSGMSGGDLAALTREAGLHALRTSLADDRRVAEAGGAPVPQAELKAAYGRFVARVAKRWPGLQVPYETYAHLTSQAIARDHGGWRPGMKLTKARPHVADSGVMSVTVEVEDHDGDLVVSRADFEAALTKIRPAGTREFTTEKPTLAWDDVAGQAEAKLRLKEAIVGPTESPKAYARLGIRPASAVLLFGPPGNGKTRLAEVVASQTKRSFFSVSAKDLLSKWYAESPQKIAELFQRARDAKPAVIFLDEADAIMARRAEARSGSEQENNRVVDQLLVEMTRLAKETGVTLICATNRPDILDPAFLRPERFDQRIYVGMPDGAARRDAFAVHTRGRALAKDVRLAELAKRTEHYSGADIAGVVNEAAKAALREDGDAQHIAQRHFLKALRAVRPSVSARDREAYEALAREYGGAPID